MLFVGQSVIVAQSSEWVISLDKRTLNLPYFCGLLGDRGWELVAVHAFTNPQMFNTQSLVPVTTCSFKRSAPDAMPG